MAVAMGAPIKPRRMGAGPHTSYQVSNCMCGEGGEVHTKEIIEQCIERRDNDHDARGHGE